MLYSIKVIKHFHLPDRKMLVLSKTTLTVQLKLFEIVWKKSGQPANQKRRRRVWPLPDDEERWTVDLLCSCQRETWKEQRFSNFNHYLAPFCI